MLRSPCLNNNRVRVHEGDFRVRTFVEQVFFPFGERKWRRSTFLANEDRFRTTEIGARPLESITRDELQDLLDRKAAAGLSDEIVGFDLGSPAGVSYRIWQRIYRDEVDTPETNSSIREFVLSDGANGDRKHGDKSQP